MQSLRTLIIVASFAIAMAEGFFLYNNEGLSTSQQFGQDVQTVVHDVQKSILLKKKAVADAISAVSKAKVGVVKDAKEVTVQAVHNVVGAKLAKVEAIKAGNQAFVNTLTGKFNSPTQRHVINREPPSREGLPTKLYSFLHTGLPNKEQNRLLGVIRKLLSQLPSFSRKQAAPKDYIKIGDTEYVFVSATQRPMANGEDDEYENVKFTEAPIQKMEPVLYTSTPESSIPPAPTLRPMSYNTASGNIDLTRHF